MGSSQEEIDLLSLRRSEEWNKFYERELDALEWAKDFMERYEKKHGRK